MADPSVMDYNDPETGSVYRVKLGLDGLDPTRDISVASTMDLSVAPTDLGSELPIIVVPGKRYTW